MLFTFIMLLLCCHVIYSHYLNSKENIFEIMSYKYLYIFFCLNGLIHLKDSSMGLADRRPFSTSTILELHCCTIFGSCYLQPINCALTSLFFVLNFKLYAAICGCRRAAAAPVVCFCHRSKLDLLCPVAAQFQLDTMSHLWLIYFQRPDWFSLIPRWPTEPASEGPSAARIITLSIKMS